MRTTADVTMVPPKPATPTNDSSTAAASSPSPDGAFQKKLEGAQQKQKPPTAKAGVKAVNGKPVAKGAGTAEDDVKAVDAEETAAETASEDVEVAQTQTAQPTAKVQVTGKQAVAEKSAGNANAKSSKTKQPQLNVPKPVTAKPKVARPADEKEEADGSDAKGKQQDDSAGAQVVANAQAQPSSDPVEQDATTTNTDSDDLTAKVVVPAKTSNADAATKASAPAGSDENAVDFDDALEAAQDIAGPDDDSTPVSHAAGMDAAPTAILAAPLQTGTTAAGAAKVQAPAAAAPVAPEAQFVSANHPSIVTGIHGKLLPNGGTMTLRLDPPELGALQVSVHMRDGVMTAAFETSNDQATRLVSHSLSQLKSALESAGMSVEKLHVQQSPRQESGDGGERQSNQKQDQQDQREQARQEQQRRHVLNKMWRKLAGGEDPLDLVA
jgi:flagellar hook-length control protein FliK